MARTTRPLPTINPSASSTSCTCPEDALICNCVYVSPTGAAWTAFLHKALPHYEKLVAEHSAPVKGKQSKWLPSFQAKVRRVKLLIRLDDLKAEMRAEEAL
jgi:hypothetical protein